MEINCDLGEGLDNDAQIMPYIDSCNIACGAHAGSLELMHETVLLAKEHDVKIGAHPSFLDRENFGRKEMDISQRSLIDLIRVQVLELIKVSEKQDVNVTHVKLHGALYNMSVKNEEVAGSVVKAIEAIDTNLIMYVPFGSVIASKLLAKKMPVYYESFADRMYNNDLTLVGREHPQATIENADFVGRRIKQLIDTETIPSIQGDNIYIKSDTICVHGDNPNVIEIVKKLSKLIR